MIYGFHHEGFFDELIKHKEAIENSFGHSLKWKRFVDKKMSRVSYKLEGVNVLEIEDWPQMLEFISTNMITFEESMRDVFLKVKKKLRAFAYRSNYHYFISCRILRYVFSY